MDSLGKMLDVSVMMVILFILPINWALNVNGEISQESVKHVVNKLTDEMQQNKKLENDNLRRAEYQLCSLPAMYSLEISVKRIVSDIGIKDGSNSSVFFERIIVMKEIFEDISKNGIFDLYSGDILEVRIYDKTNLFYIETVRIL